VENFYRKYFGLDPAPVLPERITAFLDRALELQRSEGPTTKGSSLIGNTRRE